MAEEKEVKTPDISAEEAEDSELTVYELGFHILPSVSIENIGAEFSRVKSIIEEKKGVFLSEDFPKLRNLAYTIAKSTQGKKQKYDSAYFSWIKFEAPAESIAEIKKSVEALDSILRFIIIKTVKENTLYTPKPLYLRADPNRTARRNKEEQDKAATESPISEAELDKTIEELVIQ